MACQQREYNSRGRKCWDCKFANDHPWLYALLLAWQVNVVELALGHMAADTVFYIMQLIRGTEVLEPSEDG